MRYDYLKKSVLSEEINLNHIPTEDQLGHLLTMPLPDCNFYVLMKIVVHSPMIETKGELHLAQG